MPVKKLAGLLTWNGTRKEMKHKINTKKPNKHILSVYLLKSNIVHVHNMDTK